MDNITKQFPWYLVAKGEMDISEIAGSKHNKRILEYHQTTTLRATSDEVAWCASFVGFCLQKSGYESTKSAAARSYLQYGEKLEKPVEGCIVVFKRGSNPAQGHVGFYVGETQSTINVLGGNQNNKVCLKHYNKADLLAYRMPKGYIDAVIDVLEETVGKPPIEVVKPKADTSDIQFGLNFVFKNEGAYSNHKDDKGGATMWGVTKIEWEKYHGKKFTDEEIRQMKLEDAAIIFKTKYYDYAGLDDITDKYKATAIFDQCINWGVQVGVDFAAEASGLKTHKSIMLTVEEIDRINAMDRVTFVNRFADIAIAKYTKHGWLPWNWAFRKGWIARGQRLKTLAVKETTKGV